MNMYRVSLGPRSSPRLVFEAMALSSMDCAMQHLALAQPGECMRVDPVPRKSTEQFTMTTTPVALTDPALGTPPALRFCVDCRHHAPGPIEVMALCTHRPGAIDLVTGRPQPRLCSLEREYACGRDARNFQPKD